MNAPERVGDVGRAQPKELRRRWEVRPTAFRVTPEVAADLIRVCDVLACLAISLAFFVGYVGFVRQEFSGWAEHLLATALGGILFFYFSYALGGRRRTDFRQVFDFKQLAIVWSIVGVVLLSAAFVLKISDQYSRVWALGWFSLTLLYIGISRWLLYPMVGRLVRQGILVERCAFVGSFGAASELESVLKRSSIAIKSLGLFQHKGIRGERDIADLERFVLAGKVDRILLCAGNNVAKDDEWGARFSELILTLLDLPVRVQVCTRLSRFPFAGKSIELVDDFAIQTVVDSQLKGLNILLKRGFDFVGSLGLLFLCLPLLVVISVAIKFSSSGPVLFRQPRYGLGCSLFTVFKFRTFYHHHEDKDATRLTVPGDSRVTPIGRFLRRMSLDELPQLLNVLQGSMSLVGPRPHAMMAKAGGELYPEVVAEYFVRYRIKPGITGWAQVNGWRGETDTLEKIRKRVEYDLYYIQNWSLLLDVGILLRTIVRIWDVKGAY